MQGVCAIYVHDARPRSWWFTLQEAWRFREAIGLLTYQRLANRYRRSILGFLWAFLNPLIQITVIAVVFGILFHQNTPGPGGKSVSLSRDILNNFAYVATGLLPWQFFQNMVTGLANVFVGAEGMVKKIYLPMLIFPLSQILAGVMDLIFALIAMGVLFIVLRLPLHPTIFIALPGILLLAVFTLGVTLLVAVTTVYFRDIAFVVGVFLQLWYLATPIMWPWTRMPQRFLWVFKANPFWNFLLFFRATLQDGQIPPADVWLKCTLWTLAAFVAGFSLYRGVQRKMIFRL
ncbi:MAG: ABC transporter permease [Planctomycetota bacterium]